MAFDLYIFMIFDDIFLLFAARMKAYIGVKPDMGRMSNRDLDHGRTNYFLKQR